MAGMKLLVIGSGSTAPVRLVDPEDVHAFSVVSAAQVDDVARVLTDHGAGGTAAQPGHVTVSIDFVQRNAAGAVGVGWDERFLRWRIQHDNITFPKSSDTDRMRQNMEIFDFDLTAEEMAGIDAMDRGGRVGLHPDEWH